MLIKKLWLADQPRIYMAFKGCVGGVWTNVAAMWMNMRCICVIRALSTPIRTRTLLRHCIIVLTCHLSPSVWQDLKWQKKTVARSIMALKIHKAQQGAFLSLRGLVTFPTNRALDRKTPIWGEIQQNKSNAVSRLYFESARYLKPLCSSA